MKTRPGRWLRRVLLGVLAMALLVALLAAILIRFAPGFGAAPAGARLARMQASPNWRGDRFVNLQAMWRGFGKSGPDTLEPAIQLKRPPSPDAASVPMLDDSAARLARPIRGGLRITWFGHSTALIEIDGRRLLLDPVWSERVTPLLVGPKRWCRPLLPLQNLRDVDAVLISHDHYDHLDMPTIRAMRDWKTRFIVPLGIGAHLERWGIPPDRITELDWWDETNVGNVRIAATPARHASGRINPQRDRVLWAGYAMLGPKHRVWYSGDTGLLDAMHEIGRRYGPFDVSLVEAGQYDWRWPDWHIGPEQAVLGHRWARGRILIPVHWALFDLAPHDWTEPAERILAAARCQRFEIATPRPGQPWEPGDASTPWWPRGLPWLDARQRPIIATRDGNGAHRYPVPACVGAMQARPIP